MVNETSAAERQRLRRWHRPGFAPHRVMWVGGCEMNEVDAAAATLIERKMVNHFGTMRTWIRNFTSRSARPGDLLLRSSTRLCPARDRKSTRLNSSHANISYAVFC